MKKVFFTLSMLFFTFVASAQYTKSIHLIADDGTDMLIALSRSLVLSFSDNNLIVNDGEQQVSVSLDKVNITYSTDQTTDGIFRPQTEQQEEPMLKDGAIFFQGLKAGQTVRVYTADGKFVTKLTVKDGRTKIDLSLLPKGISIIQAGNHTLKYNRR